MASEGTSLEDIENGNVAHSADDAVMNAILADMNATEESVKQPVQTMYLPPPPQPPQPPQYQSPPIFEQPSMHPMHQMQPMMTMQPMQPMQPMQTMQPTYEQVETESQQESPTVFPKKNKWSHIFDELREPIVVGLLVCFFSLPALHTWLSKRLTWAYKVGGSLSWLGFLMQFILVGGIYATYRQIMTVVQQPKN